MKKVLIGIVTLLILGGGGYWYYTNKMPASKKGNGLVEETNGDDQTDKESYSGSLKDMINLGASLKCTWSSEEASGTSWIKGEKTFTEVNTPEGEFNAITKENCAWSWLEGNANGVKVCYDTQEELYSEGSEGGEEADTGAEQQVMEPPADVEYDCKKAVINDSRFNPPSGVNFMDWEDMMQGNVEDLQQNIEDLDLEGF